MTAVEFRRRVVQHDAPVMFFHDALDDRQAEAGALLARGHIGLGQTVPVFLRQADAIVGHADERRAAFSMPASTRMRPLIVWSSCCRGLDRLARVLDEIGDRLGDQAPIEGEDRSAHAAI